MSSLREVGTRLRQHREAVGLSAGKVALQAGVSRALLYRYEAGEIIKVPVLDRLARIYGTSTMALLGLAQEYITSGPRFFERIQKLEERADHMVIVFGPLAYVLTSDSYDSALTQAMNESVEPGEALTNDEAKSLLSTLKRRKALFRYRKPGLVHIIPVAQLAHYAASGLTTRSDLPYAERNARRRAAAREIEHLLALISNPPMGVQIGLTRRPLPTAGFQILRMNERKYLVLSPFRVGEELNLRYGVATITEDDEALRVHETLANRLWETSLTGSKAQDEIQKILKLSRP